MILNQQGQVKSRMSTDLSFFQITFKVFSLLPKILFSKMSQLIHNDCKVMYVGGKGVIHH